MSWKNHVIVLTLVAGTAFTSPTFASGAAPRVGRTEVRVATPAVKLKRLRYKAPVYPRKALQAQLSGFVAIEFVVNANGEPVGLRVIDAWPAEVFEDSVLRAAKRWRYQPRVINNAPTETPARMIVLFKTHS